MRRYILAAGAAALALSVAACGGGSSTGASGGKDYVVGYVNGLSGGLAIYGQYSLSYLQATVKSTNDAGGIDGRKVLIDILDSAAVGQSAVSATQQMITRNHPDVIYGMTLDNDCAAAAPIAAKYKTPLVCETMPAAVASPVQPYVFGALALEPSLATPAVEAATSALKLGPGSTLATFVGSGGGGEPFAKEVQSLGAKAGLKLVSAQVVPTTAANVSAQVSNIAAKKPDVVFAEVIGSQLSPLVQGLRAAGVKSPVIAVYVALGYDGLVKMADPNFYELAQTDFVTDQTAAASPGVAQVQKLLSTGGMTDPTKQNQLLGAQDVLPAMGLIQALKSCGGSCTPAKMATAMQSVKLSLSGFAADYAWTSSDHVPLKAVSLIAYDPTTKASKTVASGLATGPLTGE